MGWKDPATPKQRQFILALGGQVKENMTVEEASQIIEELLKKKDNKIMQEIAELCQRYVNLRARIQLLKDKITCSAVYARESKLYSAIYKKINLLHNKESKAVAKEFAKKFGIQFL
jgi:hypothetical protein